MGEALSVPEGIDGVAGAMSQKGGESASEGVLLSQLIQLLSQRPRHSLLLSDLGALLPSALRQRANEQGGLATWIGRYPSLFSVSGAPGKETLTLILGSPLATATPSAPGGLGDSSACSFAKHEELSAEPPLATSNEAAQHLATTETTIAAAHGGATGDSGGGFDEELDGLCTLQLRGLPYKATADDVRGFLGDHCAHLAAGPNSIYLMVNRDGRPSGFARVSFESPDAARRCRDELHLRSMEDRYVEVFLYNERPSRTRPRKGLQEDGLQDAARPPGGVHPEAAGITVEHVVRECRTQMADPNKRRILLSMLGVALSPGARAYLKQMDQGLKHFLAQFPSEFSVDGGKGSEYVTYTPIQLSEAIEGLGSRSTGAVGGNGSEHAYPTSPERPRPAASLDPTPSVGHGLATPSNWGTPCPPGMGMPWSGASASNWLPPWPGAGAGSDGLAGAGGWGATPPWPVNPAQFWPGLAGWPGQFPAWEAPQAAAASVGGAAASSAGQERGQTPSHAGAAPAGKSSSEKGAGKDAIPGPGHFTAVRLRGLPFSASEQDVLAFFAQHEIVDRVSEGPNAVTLLQRSNGRSSGQAVIQMKSRVDAELAQCVLGGQWMGSRYIEVFLYSEEFGFEQGSGTSAGGASAPGGGAAPASCGVRAAQGANAKQGAAALEAAAQAAQIAQAAQAAQAAAAAFDALSLPWAASPWSMAPGLGADGSATGDADANAAAVAAAAAAASVGAATNWQELFEFLSHETDPRLLDGFNLAMANGLAAGASGAVPGGGHVGQRTGAVPAARGVTGAGGLHQESGSS